MLTVNILGHTHITHKGTLVPLSAKAVALITYLTLERLPQHRERLADLLWYTAEARKNLRVELARIRSAGLDIFPRSRQLLYLEHVITDLDVWRSRLSSGMDQPELAHWLSMLRGLPLSGMEDLGSTALQEWVDQQRCTAEEQVEQILSQAHQRFEADNKPWATRIILARAAALGYHLDVEPAEVQPRRTPPPVTVAGAESSLSGLMPATAQMTRPLQASLEQAPDTGETMSDEDERLLEVLERAQRQPQLVVIHGPLGSGKSHLAERVLRRQDWTTVRVRSTRLSRLVIASVAQELSRVADAADSETLRRLLLHPGTLEEDAVKLATLMARLPTPVALVLDHTQSAPVELASLLEFILQSPAAAPRTAILLSRTPPGKSPLCRSLLRRFDHAQCTQIEMNPLTVRGVERILRGREPRGVNLEVRAAELLQRSEGNVLHLLSLLEQPSAHPGALAQRLPTFVREQYAGEIDGWPETLREALGHLSVINGDFDLRVMRAALDSPSPAHTQAILKEALERTVLIEREADRALDFPSLEPLEDLPGSPELYAFRSEGLRVSLAGSLPHDQRQAVRRRLAAALEDYEPGLALYYAERVGQEQNTERLRRAYQSRLAPDSPLLGFPGGEFRDHERRPRPVPAPPRIPEGSPDAQTSLTWQGYTLSRGGSGWLSIVSQGRSGHPRTLRLRLNLPPATDTHSPRLIQLVWRLDMFQGGNDLGPLRAPFALRLHRLGDPEAHVFAPELHRDYLEDGLRHVAHPDLGTGQWMVHRLTLPPAREPHEVLELNVRGLDVALSLGRLEIDGTELLGHGAAAPVMVGQVSSFD
ncbi:AAA family ATPase [Deinococcus koreensis]|uniref:SARP family transcriptional regulator n=1 Tax=Deinococcus koreensis TaxID=2054903 RepID=A0A2K3UTA7_9DEIO|nr:AAA family ATPase [Deinococcus koreensis]PNY79772.1 SARP family transcriptional regulator [Deinococcus koreensis]